MRMRTVKTVGPLRFKKLRPEGEWFDARKAPCYCGLHTIRVVVRVPKNALTWKKIDRRGILKTTESGGIVVHIRSFWARQDVEQVRTAGPKRKQKKYIRLSYNRGGYLVLRFEPDGNFPFAGTDLLPLGEWAAVWSQIAKIVAEEVNCPDLFDSYPVLLSRFDLAFDIVNDDPTRLVHSLSHLPEDRRVARIKSITEWCVKSSSKQKRAAREISKYDREKKSGGFPITRIEFRCRKPDTVRRALGFKVKESTHPLNLAEQNRLTKYVDKMLETYGIYPGAYVVPLRVAVNTVPNPWISAALEKFDQWVALKRFRYYSKQLRDKEGLAIGTTQVRNVYNVAGLHEAMIAAFRRSWGT